MTRVDAPPSNPPQSVAAAQGMDNLGSPFPTAEESGRILRRIGANRDLARTLISRIIGSYDSLIIRTYSRIRFLIMRVRFLEELDQYIPEEGHILDLGCGFGLFSLYFASSGDKRQLFGVDIDATRVEAAQLSAKRLRLGNVTYTADSALDYPIPSQLACAYMLDLLHHLPKQSVRGLLVRVYDALLDQGVMLVKDVDTRPFYKRWFTLALDRAMVGWEPIHYWPVEEMVAMLETTGFQVHTHEMRDILPYPHRLYICRKT